jgi:hypothetical protein
VCGAPSSTGPRPAKPTENPLEKTKQSPLLLRGAQCQPAALANALISSGSSLVSCPSPSPPPKLQRACKEPATAKRRPHHHPQTKRPPVRLRLLLPLAPQPWPQPNFSGSDQGPSLHFSAVGSPSGPHSSQVVFTYFGSASPHILSLSADYPGPFLFLLVFKPLSLPYPRATSLQTPESRLHRRIHGLTLRLAACVRRCSREPAKRLSPTPWYRHPRLRLISDSPRVFFLASIRKGRITYIRLHTRFPALALSFPQPAQGQTRSHPNQSTS